MIYRFEVNEKDDSLIVILSRKDAWDIVKELLEQIRTGEQDDDITQLAFSLDGQLSTYPALNGDKS